MTRAALIIGLLTSVSTPALAQESASPATQAQDNVAEPDEIVVVAATSKVLGDIPPETTLDAGDIRATGATTIAELMEAVSAQTGSSRGRGGGRPIMLLNGKRISSWREMRDLPTEAIARMEIFPEEVALSYGYSADQRVINIVLRDRFGSRQAELEYGGASDGGYQRGEVELGLLNVRNGRRTSVNLDIEANSPLTEDERDISLQPVAPLSDALDPRAARSLVAGKSDIRLNASTERELSKMFGLSVNGEYQQVNSDSLLGLQSADISGVVRGFADGLERDSQTDSAHLGLALSGAKSGWNISSTLNGDVSRTVSETERGYDVSAVLDPMATSLLPLPYLSTDQSWSENRSLSFDTTANRGLFETVAGQANATLKVAAATIDQSSFSRRSDVLNRKRLGRDSVELGGNINIPLFDRDSLIGQLGINLNAKVEEYSDAGTLTNVGGGLNWRPSRRLSLIASATREEGAPSLSQLGDPVLVTPGAILFDYVAGQSAIATVTSGGNPDLRSDRRTVFKLGGNWQVIAEKDLNLRVDYVRQTVDDPITSFPGLTGVVEAAFPDRFVRDDDGELIAADLRAFNGVEERKDTLRVGLDWSKSIKSKPPSAETIAKLRARFAANRPEGAPPPTGEGAQAQSGEARRGPPGGGRFRGGGGRFGGGRLGVSLTDTITLVDEATLLPGLNLDYLNGDARSSFGGSSRHNVEGRLFYMNNGLGARLGVNWKSATEVTSGSTGPLRFDDYGTLDLRLWANMGSNLNWVADHPWMRGMSLRIGVDNLTNARPEVKGADGSVPLAYQGARLEPLGRTVSIGIRKMFIPRSFFGRSPDRSGMRR